MRTDILKTSLRDLALSTMEALSTAIKIYLKCHLKVIRGTKNRARTDKVLRVGMTVTVP